MLLKKEDHFLFHFAVGFCLRYTHLYTCCTAYKRGEHMYDQPPLQPYPYGSPMYPPPAPRRRFPIVRVILFIFLALVLIAGYFILTAKSSYGFLNSEDTLTVHVLRYLNWTESNGQINGYWSIAEVQGNKKPVYGNGSLVGTHNGNAISITFGSYTDTGTLDGDTLTLQAPMPDGTLGTLVYQSATQDQYEQALGNFKMAYGG